MGTACASSGFHTRVSSHAWQDNGVDLPPLILLCRCSNQRFALPAARVARVLSAAQFVSVAGLSGCAVGILNVANVNLALCDARIALGLPQVALLPTDHFIELEPIVLGARRWLLWVEEVIGIISVTDDQFDVLSVTEGAMVGHALRLPLLEAVPLLDLAAVEPNALVAA